MSILDQRTWDLLTPSIFNSTCFLGFPTTNLDDAGSPLPTTYDYGFAIPCYMARSTGTQSQRQELKMAEHVGFEIIRYEATLAGFHATSIEHVALVDGLLYDIVGVVHVGLLELTKLILELRA